MKLDNNDHAIDAGDFFELAPHTVMKTLDDETVLLNKETEIYFGLEEVGTCILNALLKPMPIENAVTSVQELFDVQPEDLERDVLALISECLSSGLLVQKPSDR